MDSIFLLSMLFVFITSLVAVFLSRTSTDRCLKKFREYFASAVMKDGRTLSGNFNLYATGIELTYDEPDSNDPQRSSGLIFSNEISDVIYFARYHSDLTEELQQTRLKAIKRSRNPSIFRRSGRRFRNAFAAMKDAIIKAFEMAVGKLKQTVPGSTVLQTQDSAITAMGKTAAGYAGTSYDVMFEKCLWEWVLVDFRGIGTLQQVWGILEEYSDKFIILMEATVYREHKVTLSDKASNCTFEGVGMKLNGNTLNIRALESLRRIGSVTCGLSGETLISNRVIKAGDSIDLKIDSDKMENGTISVVLSVDADADVILPRAAAVIRHRLHLPEGQK